jgi:hypothetical protein
MCFAGLCHGEAGAETLRQWKFPASLIEAVRFHHRSECSSGCLASLLYLGEFWSDSDEDLPSCVCFRTALARAGIEERTLEQIGHTGKGYLECLRFAASRLWQKSWEAEARPAVAQALSPANAAQRTEHPVG